MTNILTAIGELYIFRKTQNKKVWTAMFLMVNAILPPTFSAQFLSLFAGDDD
jgi:hypothetical protein